MLRLALRAVLRRGLEVRGGQRSHGVVLGQLLRELARHEADDDFLADRFAEHLERVLRLLVLRVGELHLVEHRLGRVHQVDLGDAHLLALLQAAESRELAALHDLADDGGDLAIELLADVLDALVSSEQPTGVQPDETLGRLGIGRRDGDDRVEATRTQHRRVDVLDVVRGEHDDDLARLRVHAVDGVEDAVHLIVAVALEDRVDVFREDDGLAVLLREEDGLAELRHAFQVDERPLVVDRLLRGDVRRERLAGAVRTFEQDAALERDLELAALLGLLDGNEDRVVDLRLHVFREDELVRLRVREVEELGSVGDGIEVLVVHVRELHPDGLATVDALVGHQLTRETCQLGDLRLVLLANDAADDEDGLVVLHRHAGLDVPLDAGDLHAAPRNLHVLRRRDGNADHHGRARAEEARRRDESREAVLPRDGPGQRVRAVEGECVDFLVDRDVAVFLDLLATEPLHAVVERHPLGEDDLGPTALDVDVLDLRVFQLLLGHCFVFRLR